MRYQFLEIIDTTDGPMAYLLDHHRGVVVVAPVEYFQKATREDRPYAVPIHTREENKNPSPHRIPVTRDEPKPEKGETIDIGERKETPRAQVPPAFRAMMNPPGPGEAIETRIA